MHIKFNEIGLEDPIVGVSTSEVPKGFLYRVAATESGTGRK